MRSVRERHSDLFDAPGSAREEKLRLLATASQVLAASFELTEPLRQVAQLPRRGQNQNQNRIRRRRP